MKRQTKGLEIKIGLFVGAGILVVMASILVLGDSSSLFSSYYTLRTRLSEVQGLLPGSVVSLAGVPVGNVEDIGFVADQNKLEVRMRIDSEFQPRISEGTIAEVRTQGALGDKYIYLEPGEPSSRPLREGSLIESKESDLMSLLMDREDGMARVIDLIKELHVLIASINANGQTASLIRNVSETARKANSTLAQLDALLEDLRAEIPENKKLRHALVSLSSILEKIDQGKGSLGQLINDPSVHQNLKTFLGGSPRNRYMKDVIRESIQQSEAHK